MNLPDALPLSPAALAESAQAFAYNPVGWVHFAFGGAVEPDAWQQQVLNDIAQGLKRNSGGAVRVAVASGHGVGKSALISWIIMWFITTRPHPQIVTTANTQSQLTTKTWRELKKWIERSRYREILAWTATTCAIKGEGQTWCANAIPWSEHNSEAFAGTHEEHVAILFDEASAIPDLIWEVAEGGLTTPGALQIAFGNPTKNTGRFRECWGKFKHRWITHRVDSRTAKMANKAQLDQWIEDYGLDSDFVRVRILGEFPNQGDSQFVPSGRIHAAVAREIDRRIVQHEPRLLGIDVARFGEDQTVFAFRQGRKLFPLQRFRGLDLMETVGHAGRLIREFKPDIVFVDGVGLGAGVVDRLRQLGHKIVDVQSGARAQEHTLYRNLRVEMWARMAEWLKGADIPDDSALIDDLGAPEYSFDASNRIALERKEDLKRRGLASPDSADALALTFSYPSPVSRKGMQERHVQESLLTEIPSY